MKAAREIKFRGLSINGEWYYGNLAVIAKKIDHIQPGCYISNAVGMPFAYQVRPETVGQFTGLLDKKGNEIYEGDILKFRDTIVKVFFNTSTACFDIEYEGGDLDPLVQIDGWLPERCEVIGTIYTHPELLTTE